MPAHGAADAAVERWSGYLGCAGLAIIAAGLVLTAALVGLEFYFQLKLLALFKLDYKWKPIGVSYVGVVVIGIGALTTAFAAVIALRGWLVDRGSFLPTQASNAGLGPREGRPLITAPPAPPAG